jgi:isoamylase
MPPFTTPGRSSPLGARVYARGVNFALYARGAAQVELLLFNSPDDPLPAEIIPLDPRRNCTANYWHIFVPGLKSGQIYAFRASGRDQAEPGFGFDPQKLLLDPYGRGLVFPAAYDRGAACRPGDNTPAALKSVVANPSEYDWEGDLPLRHPFVKTVIYEMHLAGFTRHPNSAVSADKRGTYSGLVEKIPYLQELGITAVELLPIFAFDPQDAPGGRSNYWGYSPISFFAPHPFYAAQRSPLGPLDEFRNMVKALHRAGIEVILDVVYNHTSEGGRGGPTQCFRGLANDSYYMFTPSKQDYANYTGTGNTMNANDPIVRRMITDSLRYWVSEMHVDGFRFDLASILSRDEDGTPLAYPAVLWDIDTDPYLAGTKLIAEAWDAGGLYQVGSFIGDQWKEWNGKFRDDVRAYLKGDSGCIANLPKRLLASPDLYEHENREAGQSINFITCHDGFTLNDLVSYNQKHNLANGEDNRDGSDNNTSWNHGVEGPSSDPQIEQLRERQIKNALALTLLSMGTPMLLMGDEVRHTQQGNNNAYCQDNELTWFDWRLVDKNPGLKHFTAELIRFRLHFTSGLQDDDKSLSQVLRESLFTWHGAKLFQPDWSTESRALAVTISGQDSKRMAHLLFNTSWEPCDFALPPLPGRKKWRRLMDTNLAPPEDILNRGQAPVILSQRYLTAPRSVVLLVAG